MLESTNPATKAHIDTVPIDDSAEVQAKISDLNDAQQDWCRLSVGDRIERLRPFIDSVHEKKQSLIDRMVEEQGKPLSEARSELHSCISRTEYFFERAPEVLGPKHRDSASGTKGRIRREPYGVVGAIMPWNFPMNLPLWAIIPALLAGNSVLFKPSELTPLCGQRLYECFPDIIKEDVLYIVQGRGNVGQMIVDSPDVHYVSFIGSRATGQAIYEASASNLRPVSLELGGKDPLIVLEDADMDAVMSDLKQGAYKNCGQVCCGFERALIHEKHYGEFFERTRELISDLTIGPGKDDPDVGPMISDEQRRTVENHIQDARSKGAQVVQASLDNLSQGFFQPPALIVDAMVDMTVMNDETFGPVLAARSYRDDEGLIEEANRLPYGLSASIYSTDPEHASDVAERVRAGSIGVNQPVGSVVEFPWGGVKDSGVGRMLNDVGIRTFTETTTERWHKADWPYDR